MSEVWPVYKKITRKIWIILLIVLAAIPIIHPLMLPIPVSPRTQAFYDVILKTPKGSVVVIGFSIVMISVYNDIRTFYVSLLELLCQRNFKIIFTSFGPDSPIAAEDLVKRANIEAKYNYVYGKDYVILPYAAGDETAMAATAADFWATYAADNRGNKLSDLSLMKNVRSMKDVSLAIVEYHIFTYGEMFVRQWPVKYGVPTIVDGQYYGISPYYGSYVLGNVDTFLRAEAEFEKLSGVPGEEMLKLEAANLEFFLIVIMIFAGLVVSVSSARKAPIKEEAKR